MVGKGPEKNNQARFFRGRPYLTPSRRLQLDAELEQLARDFGGLDALQSEVDRIRSESTTATGSGNVSGPGHDGSSAGGAGVVPGSSQASNIGNNRRTGLQPKPSGSGVGSFADAVRRDGREKNSSGGAGMVPGSSQASNTGNNRPTGPKPKSSGSGIGNYASAVRRGDREETWSGKGKSSGGISKDQPWKDKPQRGHQSKPSQELTWVKNTYEEVLVDAANRPSARRLVNDTVGGGPQTQIACQWRESVRGNVATRKGAIELLHGAQRVFPEAEGFYVSFHPVDPNHFDSVEAVHTRRKITYDDDRTRGSVSFAPGSSH
jgi:hypothetical protein